MSNSQALRVPSITDAPRGRQRIALDDIQNPMLRKGLALWERMRGENRFPARAQMSPREMSGLLRNTVLVKVLDNGADFQFRIVGDAIVMAQGASFQGMTMGEIDQALPGYGTMLRDVYTRVYETGEPLAFRGWFERSADKRPFFHESLVLPLGDGQTVDHILVIGVYAFEYEDALR
jgi:hypothetical protein